MPHSRKPQQPKSHSQVPLTLGQLHTADKNPKPKRKQLEVYAESESETSSESDDR